MMQPNVRTTPDQKVPDRKLTTLLVGLAKQQLLTAFQRSTAWIKRASGVILILAGLYLAYYYVAAGM